MCGRFVMLDGEGVRTVARAVEQGAADRMPVAAHGGVEVLPGSAISIARTRGDALALEECTWGFARAKGRGLVFNTRIESALSGAPMWCKALQDGRCIVPAATFFEVHATEKALSPRTGKPLKRPYAFRSLDGGPLLMAGISEEGCCSIVTCESNSWVGPVHARMPLVLRFEEVRDWLHGTLEDLAALADRSDMAFDVRPELELAPAASREAAVDQLSLF